MHTTTETLRQGDTITGSVTTIEYNGLTIETRSFGMAGAELMAEVARRVDQHEQLIKALQDIARVDLRKLISAPAIAREALAATGNNV